MKFVYLTLFLAFSIGNSIADTAEDIFSRVSKSIVLIISMDSEGNAFAQGSGVVIAPGRVITNWHVVQDADSIIVKQNNTNYPAQVISDRRGRDLVSLSVPGIDSPPVEMSNVYDIKIGQQVYAVGAPTGLELTISNGIVSALRDAEGSKIIQTNAAISPGSSGGGLFDDQGKLIGITTFKFAGENLNFALPVDWVQDFALTGDGSSGEGSSDDAITYLKILAGIVFIAVLLSYRSRILDFVIESPSATIHFDDNPSDSSIKKNPDIKDRRGPDRYYPVVKEELKNNIKDEALWIDATASSNGSSETAMAKYIQLRATDLQKIDMDKLWKNAAENANKDSVGIPRSWSKDFPNPENSNLSKVNEDNLRKIFLWIIGGSVVLATLSFVMI